MSILNLLSGFTKGFAQGRMLKESKQERLAAAKEKQKLIDFGEIRSQGWIAHRRADGAIL